LGSSGGWWLKSTGFYDCVCQLRQVDLEAFFFSQVVATLLKPTASGFQPNGTNKLSPIYLSHTAKIASHTRFPISLLTDQHNQLVSFQAAFERPEWTLTFGDHNITIQFHLMQVSASFLSSFRRQTLNLVPKSVFLFFWCFSL
jgi:hypothetical protein